MTNDFDDVYWMLDTGFRPMVVDSRQYYILVRNHQCFSITKLGKDDRRDFVQDQYRCSLSKSARTADQVCADPYHIDALKDWITASGVHPKQAVVRAINLALADPMIKDRDDLRLFKFTFNPVVRFVLDCISFLTNKL